MTGVQYCSTLDSRASTCAIPTAFPLTSCRNVVPEWCACGHNRSAAARAELSGVSSLRRLGGSLAETKRRITTVMSKDLLQLALGYELEGGPPSQPSEALASELDARLLPLAVGLLRLRLLHEAIQSLEEQMLRDVRTLFVHVPQPTTLEFDNNGAALTNDVMDAIACAVGTSLQVLNVAWSPLSAAAVAQLLGVHKMTFASSNPAAAAAFMKSPKTMNNTPVTSVHRVRASLGLQVFSCGSAAELKGRCR